MTRYIVSPNLIGVPEKFILRQSFGEDLWKEQVSFQRSRSAIHISEASFNSSCAVGRSFGSNVIHLRMNAATPTMSNCKVLYKSSENITPEECPKSTQN